MGTLLILIGASLFFALTVFVVCEEKSLKDTDFSDMKKICTSELNPKECMEKFDSIKYMAIYISILIVFDLLLGQFVFLPNNFGLTEAMAFTFAPSLIGSWLILLIKWSNQPVIKLISSFMYGAGYMSAAIASLVVTYFILG